jgi:SAM-dependent methyltransferase
MSEAHMDPKKRRLSFDKIAEAYQRYRPGYPDALIERIERTAGLNRGSRLLEIGCGPGKATLLFAKRGYEILCIEPGANLIRLAVENLHGYPVSFVNCLFEEWQERHEAFDLVYSAQAFHWVPKNVGYAKAAAALKPDGYLALFWNRSPRQKNDLRQQIASVYQRCAPELVDLHSQSDAEMTEYESEQAAEIQAGGQFRDVTISHFTWKQQYTTEAYLGLLSTHSDHSTLPPERLACLLDGIGEAIERFGSGLDLHYSTVLYLGRKIG